MRPIVSVLVLALLVLPTLAQGAAGPRRCGLPDDRPGSALLRPPGDCAYSSTTIRPQYAPGNGRVFEIPVVFHVISRSSGRGNIPSLRVHQQLEILNEDFRALAGTPGGLGTDVRIQFYLANVDPTGNPTNGIQRVTNNTWFDDQGQYWNTLAWDTNRYLNVYTNEPAGGVYGYVPDLPQANLAGQRHDRVVVLYSTVGRDAPIGFPYDQGRTLTHEIGHYLGLEHTFFGGCTTTGNCYVDGDHVCDTNRQQFETYGCPPNQQSCGSRDPFENYMDYTDDRCMTNFTPEQANRMRCTLIHWRPQLSTPLCAGVATSAVRTAGGNPAALSATLPVVGDDQVWTITTTPWAFALLVGFSGTDRRTLRGGQTLLVDVTSQRHFLVGPLVGPTATTTFRVPHEAALCGVSFSAQAMLCPNGPGAFGLSNALDMTIGTAP